jgi:hypothetical protein
MVNVGVGCGLLVRDLRPGDEALQTVIIQGGLLHDVGKRAVPEEVLNKEGKLDDQEWAILGKHPQAGYDQLRTNAAVPAAVLEMARDHHERPDGRGYPRGLSDAQLGLAARVCAVVDVYDAICSARPYRGPTSPSETLEVMRAGCGTQFDPEILIAWINRVQQLLAADPYRAPAPAQQAVRPSLGDFLPQPAATQRPGDALGVRDGFPDLWADERRRHDRFACDILVRAVFLRQGKHYPVALGQPTRFRLVDVSRGGMQLRSIWPLSLNDVLEVEMPAPSGAPTRRQGRVVRVRRANEREWTAGLCFINLDQTAPRV